MNLLPLMIRTGVSGLPIDTTYFDTEMCAKGLFHLAHINGNYSLLLPPSSESKLKEMETGKIVVITRGNYKGNKDSFEIMFDDGSDNPYMVIIKDEQFTRLSPLKEGWFGTLYVFSGDIEEYKLKFPYVYFRTTDNLPYLKQVEEEIDKLHNLTPLSNDEAIRALKSGERLENGVDNYDVAHYHWYGNEILKSDSYYDLVGEGETIPENKLPQLYRIGNGYFGDISGHIKAAIKSLLDSNNFPLIQKKLGLEKLIELFITLSTKGKENNYKINIEYILKELEKKNEKTPVTWEDIANSINNANKEQAETDEEKINYFKKKIIGHLDNLQKEIEDKNIIPFPQKKK